MECYVCLEENCYTLSPCKCTNLYVHPHCYVQVALNFKQCGICKEPFYTNFVEIEEEQELEGSDEDNENLSCAHYCKTVAKLIISFFLTYASVSYCFYQQLTCNAFTVFFSLLMYFILITIFGKHI